MKKTIRPYIKHLLKTHFSYIIAIGVLIMLTFFAGSIMGNRIFDNRSKIETLKKDVADLEIKKSILDATVNQAQGDLDGDVEVVKSLIPDIEDYFSIIYAFDELSKRTGFLITAYNINVQKSTSNKLALTVLGVGDSDSFLNFLKEYNFGSGRLITAEKIELGGTDQSSGIKLNLNLYNKKVSAVPEKNLNYQASIVKLREIRDKVHLVLTEEEIVSTGEAYPTKSNPF